MPVAEEITPRPISKNQLRAGHFVLTAPALLWRVAFLIALLIAESQVFPLWFGRFSLTRETGLTGFVRTWGGDVLHASVAFAVIFVAVRIFSRGTPAIPTLRADLSNIHTTPSFVAAHVCTLGAVCGLSFFLFRPGVDGARVDFLCALWLAAILLAVVLAGCAVIPVRLWSELLRGTGWLAFSASLAAISSVLVGYFFVSFWERTAAWTLAVCAVLLRPILPNVIVDPANVIIGTPAFSVAVKQPCSGLEGIALMLGFLTFWLWLYRREYRFPRALILAPLGATASWLANAVRIAALVLIGNAGAPEASVRGFHSQAGWLAFNAIALGLCITTRRIAWFKKPERSATVSEARNPALPWLLPFLAVLAAGMIAQAIGGAGFEPLYPLRFIAAMAALWCFRATYRTMDWRVSWFAPVLGLVVFAVWVGLPGHGAARSNGLEIQNGVASLPPLARITWLTFRVAAAVITVPVCEELAFRGFLIRRLMRSNFDSLSLRAFTWPAVLLSSAAFGIMHGGQWVAGIVAGLVYSCALLLRGRIADAIVAHATTNLLIAVSVLGAGNWGLW